MPVVTELPPREPSRRIAAKGTTVGRKRGRGRARTETEDADDAMDDSGLDSGQLSAEDADTASNKPEDISESAEKPPKFPRDAYTDIYPGLNDFGDALEAVPLEIVRHFTLLKEIDAKCTTATPLLTKLIKQFLSMPMEEDNARREEYLSQVRDLIRELMPCLEEKMHVAGVAAGAMARHMERLEYDWDLVVQHEFPEQLVYGNPDHPGFVTELPKEAKKSAQAARSESRREAIAAKKAAQQQVTQDTSRATLGSSSGRGVKGKPGPKPEAKFGPGRKPAAATTAAANPAAIVPSAVSSQAVGSYNPTYGVPQGQVNYDPQYGYAYPATVPSSVSGQLVYGQPQSGGYYVQAAQPGTSQYGAYAGQEPDVKRRKTTNEPWEEDSKGVSRQGTPSVGRRTGTKATGRARGKDEEPVYCYCQQVSYGEMVGCDGTDCKREWFHLPCIGLTSPPKGQWFCEDCAAKYKRGARQRN